jgi:Domain of unknown function (DUF4159)/Aerotolerance regulator N-terminal
MTGLAFLNPALLIGLLALPVIFWLLRTVPPAPKRVEFPATRILVGLEDKEKQPERTPWWLLLLRLLAAALLILALAEPVLNPVRKAAVGGSGPVTIVIDNGWSSAPRWSDMTAQVERLIAEAESQNRSVVVAPTARVSRFQSLKIETANQARSSAAAVQPYPHAPDRAATADALAEALKGQSGVSVFWVTDGIDHASDARTFAERLLRLGSGVTATLIELGQGQEALATLANLGQGGRLEANVLRTGGPARQGTIYALSQRGQRLAEAKFAFDAGAASTSARIDLPLELRNQVTRIEVAGERSAGAVHLLDSRSQWHRIGLLAGTSRELAQPLLAPLYYLDRALAPFSELAKTDDANLVTAVDGLIKRNVSIMMLADIGTIPRELKDKLDQWVKRGGVLVRFAGPRLESGGDDLLPVALRAGGRQLGGALSWSTPQPLAAFDETSLFAGLPVPGEVLVNRQVLADPARIGNEVKSWARLKDGTPLVTAAKRGDGQLVLFHVTANSEWSNLPISGLFVEMLRRIAALGKPGGVSLSGDAPVTSTTEQVADATEVLPPQQSLDGFGVLKPPPPTAQAIAADKIAEAVPSAENPPGYYGPQGTPRALNLAGPKTVLKPLPALPSTFERRAVDTAAPRPLKPALLGSALGLLFTDILATLALAGAFLGWRRFAGRGATVLVVALAGLFTLAATQAEAQQGIPGFPRFDTQGRSAQTCPQHLVRPRPPQAVPADPALRSQLATGKVTFGFVLTGDATVDRVSEQGLRGLVACLIAKTAVEPGDPAAVNIQADEIAFFPLLYWPVLPTARALPEATLAKIDAYMKNGGMIIFDTRDAGTSFVTPGATGGDRTTPLARLLGNLDLPRLEAVPEHHVLTKSFYLLRQFPGRYDNGQLWVEAESPRDAERGRQARRVDGVSSILVTSNDYASAWAVDDRNGPVFPVVPGGEPQREQAYRVGVNIVMYALTGNYKADQVHVPALLERLGN